jgi:hypothetical protein
MTLKLSYPDRGMFREMIGTVLLILLLGICWLLLYMIVEATFFFGNVKATFGGTCGKYREFGGGHDVAAIMTSSLIRVSSKWKTLIKKRDFHPLVRKKVACRTNDNVL